MPQRTPHLGGPSRDSPRRPRRWLPLALAMAFALTGALTLLVASAPPAGVQAQIGGPGAPVQASGTPTPTPTRTPTPRPTAAPTRTPASPPVGSAAPPPPPAPVLVTVVAGLSVQRPAAPAAQQPAARPALPATGTGGSGRGATPTRTWTVLGTLASAVLLSVHGLWVRRRARAGFRRVGVSA